ncbi:MFS transporter [Actinomycetospora sp. C-140]
MNAPTSRAARTSAPTRMTAQGLGVVVLCMFLNMTDGYDLFIVGFAVPHLPPGFASPGEKGLLISSALVGMGVGAIVLARLADRIGRRATVLGGLAVNIAGLSLSALSPNLELLMASRFVTGLAVGTISVVIVVIAQEASPDSRKNSSTGIVMIGFPLGSTVAGFGGAWALSLSGGAWQSLFWLGAALAVLGLVVAAAAVPESEAFLADRDGTRTEPAAREREGTADAEDVDDGAGVPHLLGALLRARTLLLATGYGMLSAAYYFVGTWTPQLITDATRDADSGATAGIVVSVGTLAGAVCFALLGLRFAATTVTAWLLGLSIVSLLGFSVLLPGGASYVFAGLLGLGVFASMVGYTALVPIAYPVLARAKGYGVMLGVGRVGAIVAPVVAGYALAVMSPNALYLAAVVPLAVAAVTTAVLLRLPSPRHRTP